MPTESAPWIECGIEKIQGLYNAFYDKEDKKYPAEK
jgi:hypothetical protein